jgi:hypothetical protein
VTKAQRILELYEQAIGTMPETQLPKFIAAQIGTSDAYVRTVARQRLGRGACEAERRYRLSDLGKATRNQRRRKRYHTDPEFRQRYLAAQSARRKVRAEARAS